MLMFVVYCESHKAFLATLVLSCFITACHIHACYSLIFITFVYFGCHMASRNNLDVHASI